MNQATGEKMVWTRLLSPQRLGKTAPAPLVRGRSPFQQDYDRIIFSSAFRRLQDKTQVFPLAESDYVRTRLTHSLEASCVARSLGNITGVHICEHHDVGEIVPSDIGAILAAAALAHDIGNPPLGHSGEDSIRYWFANSVVAEDFKAVNEDLLTPAQFEDIKRYEGNAQGFRVLTRLQMPDNTGGMQLTCATLAAFAKYPVESNAVSKEIPFSKKFSFFQSEKEYFAEVAANTGMLRRNNSIAVWARHPLAFLVEAADDICYTIIDFEDGHSLGIIPYLELEDLFVAVIGNDAIRSRAAVIREDKRKVEFLRAICLGTLVNQLSECFIQHEDAILSGTMDKSLTDLIPAAGVLNRIKERSVEDVYTYRQALEIEIAGFELTTGLLDCFVEAIEDCVASPEKASPRSKKLLRLLPEQFQRHDETWIGDPYLRLLNALDFICGMTDSYAVSLYKKIKGISLPGQ